MGREAGAEERRRNHEKFETRNSKLESMHRRQIWNNRWLYLIFPKSTSRPLC